MDPAAQLILAVLGGGALIIAALGILFAGAGLAEKWSKESKGGDGP